MTEGVVRHRPFDCVWCEEPSVLTNDEHRQALDIKRQMLEIERAERAAQTVSSEEIVAAVTPLILDVPADASAAQPPRHVPLVLAAKETVERWWPEHWPLVEAALAACATLRMKDIAQSLALFAVGDSGAGKSTTLAMFGVPEREVLSYELAKVTPPVEQLDDFTLASFLSHYAEEKKEILEKRALYRRLKDRVLLTSELALMFRGKTDVLTQKFGQLAKILDGEGLRTVSGTHGTLGHKGNYSFVWLGGTTPFQEGTWRTMAQLGTRILYYRTRKIRPIPVEDYRRARDECNASVWAALDAMLQERRKTPWPRISPTIRKEIDGLSELVAAGQSFSSAFGEDDPIRPTANHFKVRIPTLLAGRALLYGRDELIEEDLELAQWVTRSSMPASRGPVLLTLYQQGSLTTPQIAEQTGLNQQYVLKLLKALRMVEVVAQDLEERWTYVRPSE